MLGWLTQSRASLQWGAPLVGKIGSGAPRVTIIGAGVGGLALAALLARAGRRVRVFERADRLGGKASVRREAGFTFDDGPSIVVLKLVYEDLFKRLDLPLAEHLRFRELDPGFRIRGIAGERFEIRARFEDTLESVRSLGQNAATELASLMRRLDKFGAALGLAFADKAYRTPLDLARWQLVRSSAIVSPFQSYDSIVQEHISHPLLREFLSGFPGYAGYHPAKAPGSLLYLPWSLLRHGVVHPEGGVGTIPACLARIAADAGAEIRTGADVERIEGEHGRARFLNISGRSEELEPGETLVFNGDLSVLADDIAPDAFSPAERQSYRAQSPSFFTLQWELPKSVSAELELAHHNLFLPGVEGISYRDVFEAGGPYPEFPPYYVNAPSVTETALAPAGRESLFTVVSVPSHVGTSESRGQEDLERYARKCLEGLRRFDKRFPSELPAGSVFRARGPRHFEDELRQRGGQIYGPDVHTTGTLGGLFRPHPETPRWENLLLVGGSTQPGAGLPMAIQSAKIVSEKILAAG